MSTTLRVLIAEDREDDTLLVLRALQRSEYEVVFERVETPTALKAALVKDQWDVVLSDFSMPAFTALDALAIVKECGLDIPFIVISGTIGEETAVECMKAGAHDFLLKGRYTRLPVAIEREIRAARHRAAKREEERKNHHLELARQHAERLFRFKSQFVANMSHELRTPLNAIIGFSEVLHAENIAGTLTAKQRDYVGNIIESGRHLLRLINDILELSKIEAGRVKLHCEWIAPDYLVELAREIVCPLAQKQGVNLEVQTDSGHAPIYADPVRIKQILYNLLSNAIKFTPSGGTVRLRTIQRNERLIIVIDDTGIGIRAEDLPRLFLEFERIEPESGPRPEGTGLGLALTKRLVELHGGTIAAESVLGKGSTFTVDLPLEAKVQTDEVLVSNASGAQA